MLVTIGYLAVVGLAGLQVDGCGVGPLVVDIGTRLLDFVDSHMGDGFDGVGAARGRVSWIEGLVG